jgi:hypothetical protein
VFPDWIATTLDVLRHSTSVTAIVPAERILARYAEPGDPPRLITVVPAGADQVEPEQLLRVRIDVRCWAETGADAMTIWQLVHRVLTNHLNWIGRSQTRWRLVGGPNLVEDPTVALVQVVATYSTFVYEVSS